MKFRRALVTGGAGFIGSHIVDSLIKQGVEVFVIDNYRKGRKSNISHHFTDSKFLFDKVDIQDKVMDDIFRIFKPEVVFHLAAMAGVPYSISSPADSNETNVQGTVNLLELSKDYGIKRFVFSSSSSVYGGSAVLPTPETTPLNPKSPYALQKKIGEEYCKIFSNLYDLETVSLRYFNVFGPRQYGDSPYASVISSFAECLKAGSQPTIHGDGEQFRDFCYIDNVVSANLLAANSDNTLKGDVFNIGCGTTTSVNKLHELMKVKEAIYVDTRPGDVKCSQADITKAAEELGYRVLVPFDQGLDRTVEWYLNKR